MGQSIIAIAGTLLGAIVAFVSQTLTANRQRRFLVADSHRKERLEAALGVPTALLAYRHAQLARRKHELAHGGADPALTAEVRSARADAWSAVYKLELLTDDLEVRAAAYALLARIKQLKTHTDPDLLDVEGVAVHHGIQEFVATARKRLGFIP